MPDKTAQELMAEFSAARMDFEALHASLDNLTEQVIPKEVEEKLREIREEFSPKLSAAEKKMKELEDSLKEAVIREGCTVKGLRFQAVYMSPSPKWDNAKLEGYAASHPEILSLRTYGKPTVQIRKVDSNKNTE